MRCLPRIDNNSPPWGEIGTAVNGPQLFPSWPGSNNSARWDNAAIEGMTGLVPLFPELRGVTVEAFLRLGYVAGGGVGDVLIRLDVGPRMNGQAAGAPNDIDSPRVDTVVVIDTVAGLHSGDPYYVSIGTFDTDADDVVLIFNVSRIGNDILDTFNDNLAVQELHFAPA